TIKENLIIMRSRSSRRNTSPNEDITKNYAQIPTNMEKAVVTNIDFRDCSIPVTSFERGETTKANVGTCVICRLNEEQSGTDVYADGGSPKAV
ncbi:hypothetical protein Bhyg_16883, partial [Pseudolycoriella hygida]